RDAPGPSANTHGATPGTSPLRLLAGFESRRVLYLIEPVVAHLLDHPVAHHDEPRVCGREVLMSGEGRDVDIVALFPLELLRHVGPFPFEGIEAVELHVPMQVVA